MVPAAIGGRRNKLLTSTCNLELVQGVEEERKREHRISSSLCSTCREKILSLQVRAFKEKEGKRKEKKRKVITRL